MNLPLSKRIQTLTNLHQTSEIVLKLDYMGHNMSMKTKYSSSGFSKPNLSRVVGPVLITIGVVLVIFALVLSTQGSEAVSYTHLTLPTNREV